MSKQKTVLDFFSRSPAIKSESGEVNKSNVVDAKLPQTPTSSKLSSNGSVSRSKAQISSKSPSNGALAKSKAASVKRSDTPKSTKHQSKGNVLSQKGKRIKISDTDESEEDEEKNSPPKDVKRRRIVVASESEDSDEYKPEKDDEDSDSSAELSNNFSETESPVKKKRKAKKSVVSSLQMFANPKISSPRARQSNDTSAKSPRMSTALCSDSKGETPVSKQKPLRISGNDTGDEIKGSNADAREFFHEKLYFLKKNMIRDKRSEPADSPHYDPTTLHVPEEFMKKITPAMRQWWNFKADHFDAVLFFKVGKFYELYHMDAVIGVKELGLVYMKGDFAHSGFPEIAFGRYSECLIEKGYKVVRVEQTETPQMMEERCKKSPRNTRYDKVVSREICQVTTRGTRTFTYQEENAGVSNNFLLAIYEKHLEDVENPSEYGVCFVDTSIGKFTFGQFKDDRHKSKLLTLIALYPPVEILYDKASISKETLHLLNHHLTGTAKEVISSFIWNSQRALRFLQKTEIFNKEDDSLEYPETLMQMLDPGDNCLETPLKQYELAFRSFAASLWYLQKCCIEDSLLSMKLFEVYVPVDEMQNKSSKGEIQKLSAKNSNNFKQHMILDGVTLQNLEIVPLLSSGNPDGTLLGTMDYCSTNFGKRLFRNWLCSPLCNPDMISNRLDAIDDLLQIPEVVEAAVSILKNIPDLERLLSKIHTYGFARSQFHPESRAIYYEAETYNKRKINEFLSTLEGFKQTSDVISMFEPHLKEFKSSLLKQSVSSDKIIGHFPDMTKELKYFEEAFDHEVAKKQGNIIPTPGVDKEYDFATAEIDKIGKELDTFLSEQKRALNCKVSYVGTGKNRYMLEVPENKKVPSEFEFQGGRKGFKRYYTKETKNLLARLTSAEESRASALKDITRRIFARFDENYNMWKSAVHCISILDALISLVLYCKSSEVPMCRPKFFIPNKDVEPHLEIIDGRHPTFLKYFTGDDYIPNSVYIGPKRNNNNTEVNSGGRLVLVTGPNMGGKSTLMRQAGTLIIMAHLDFTRVGASDRISKGESTFFVEASETSSILHHATLNSFVLVDELGRGTATYDGTAIAYAALDYLANDIGCRTLFSTHYHSLVEDFCDHPSVGLGHMACMVEKDCDCPALEKITFLYKFSDGACPKSYGFNVALLAGIHKDIVRQGFLKAQQMEYSSKLSKVLRRLLSVMKPEEVIEELNSKYKFFAVSE
ncbi:DNA mismatch repair protein Msh6 like protein [Argiope bruennichi]|uniref:DNA mismatch repair protein n=1 Tax=Argiope bruennichi TaxID=94029 RepID=A0A8T0FJV4_ARGBR|nr:DNA mismatch repair protein Msh6 like protein [Argiope bruennichi]